MVLLHFELVAELQVWTLSSLLGDQTDLWPEKCIRQDMEVETSPFVHTVLHLHRVPTLIVQMVNVYQDPHNVV